MTKFNPNKNCLAAAMDITDEADAEQYLKDYVAHIQSVLDKEPPRKDGMSAAAIASANLGYYAGYYDNETRERVERLFKCSHPIFGSIAKVGAPTPDQAFEAGNRMAERKTAS